MMHITGLLQKILRGRRAPAAALFAMLALLMACINPPPAHADALTPTLGEDGIYHYDWYHQSFLDMQDDLQESLAAGKILMVKFDQVGCIYCERVALEILTDPAINAYVRENFTVVQLDIYGNRDVTDFDGDTMPENEMSRKWGVVFTPTIYFLASPETGGKPLPQATAIPAMPGAFGKLTFLGYLQWVVEGGYATDEPFQKYFGRRINEIRAEINNAKKASLETITHGAGTG